MRVSSTSHHDHQEHEAICQNFFLTVVADYSVCETIGHMPKRPPEHTSASTLAVRMMIDTLREVCEDVTTHDRLLYEAKQKRNEYIREVLEYIPMTRVMKLTHLSREQLYRIKLQSGQAELGSQRPS